MTKIVLLSVLLFPALGAIATEAPNPLDTEIDFWEKRLSRDAADPVTPAKLGEAYLQKSRESGNLAYLFKSEAMLKKSLEIRPKQTQPMCWLAYVYCMEHHFKEAIALSEETAKLLTDDGFPFGVIGDAYLELGDYEKCETNYLKAMELTPGIFSYARWANLLYMKGDIPESIKFYKQALDDVLNKGKPSHTAWCQVQLGYMYFKIGKLDKAEEYYQAALQSFPQSVLALEHLAELRAAQDKFAEGAALYEKAISLSPRPELYQALGDLWAFAGKPEKSEPLILKAADMYTASVNEGNIHYYHHLAGLYSDSRKVPDEAFRWARRDFDVRQGVYALDCLAWAHYQKGEFKEAAGLMKKALAYGTRDAHLFYHASMIYFRAGDVAGSKEMVKKAADLNPTYNKFHAHR